VRKTATISQAARLLGVSPSTVRTLIDSGKLPGWRVGDHRRVPLAKVEQYRKGEGMAKVEGTSSSG
jgi:excisionase family DNA binding protein